jgi:hypothetical protein
METVLSFENNGIGQKHKNLENKVLGFTGKAEVATTNYYLN